MTKKLTNKFSQRVYNLCSQIPAGHVSTYKYIAIAAYGSPHYARIVGNILSKCECEPELGSCESIHCYRVINSNFFLGGFATGQGGGNRAEIKKNILAREGIFFDKQGYLVRKLRTSKKEYEKLNQEQKDYQELSQGVSKEEQNILLSEIKNLDERKKELINKIKEQIIEEESISQNVIIEIRPGPGGDEAGLFVRDLYRMYSMKGKGVFNYLKNEAGVHRVQRIPLTAKGGEKHTSTATVVVLPEPQDIVLNIPSSDLKYDYYRSSGAGGQHVNTTDSAVRATYTYSTNGKTETIVATSQDGRSQHDNKERALTVLKSRLWEKLQLEQQKKMGNLRSTMIGTAERSENFRTYNFQGNRVVDKRLNIKLYGKIEFIMKGELEEICQKSIDYEVEKKITATDFQKAAAEEIINKLFNASEKEKLTTLIKKLGGKELGKISLITNASNWIEGYINRHIATVTGKIFKIIHNQTSPHALNLLGIINLEEKHFPESYEKFSRLLTDLRTEHGTHYKTETVKNYFSAALIELEYFIGEIENAKNTSKPKPNQQNPNKEPENNSPEQDKNTKTPRNKRLEELRAKTITEINLISNSSDTIYINNLKENLLAFIQRIKKEKIDSGKLSELIQRENYRGEKSYTSLKAEINALRKKFAEKDIDGYRNAIKEMITQELEKEAIKENELDAEIQKKLEKLRKEKMEQTEIDTIKDEVSNNTKLKSAEKILKKLLEDYKNNPSSQKKQEIINFVKSNNSFYQMAYQSEKGNVDNLLKNGGSPSQKNNSSKDEFPINPKYIIGGMTIIGLIFVLVEIFKKRKPRSHRN
ncbi:2946_t:CDS:2 [Funneliformis geosporum]|uniref:2946_t:CDS:1 n=1 Tax=Funneliformis geosporum TaxID=1117311 RepID=A0A9W4SAL0_9GLOM|nr:2946_t:CDS:2 [Funneliformis geosporum]